MSDIFDKNLFEVTDDDISRYLERFLSEDLILSVMARKETGIRRKNKIRIIAGGLEKYKVSGPTSVQSLIIELLYLYFTGNLRNQTATVTVVEDVSYVDEPDMVAGFDEMYSAGYDPADDEGF